MVLQGKPAVTDTFLYEGKDLVGGFNAYGYWDGDPPTWYAVKFELPSGLTGAVYSATLTFYSFNAGDATSGPQAAPLPLHSMLLRERR